MYYFKRGRLKKTVQRQFTVFFQEDKVKRLDRSGSVSTADAPRIEKPNADVPSTDEAPSPETPRAASES